MKQCAFCKDPDVIDTEAFASLLDRFINESEENASEFLHEDDLDGALPLIKDAVIAKLLRDRL